MLGRNSFRSLTISLLLSTSVANENGRPLKHEGRSLKKLLTVALLETNAVSTALITGGRLRLLWWHAFPVTFDGCFPSAGESVHKSRCDVVRPNSELAADFATYHVSRRAAYSERNTLSSLRSSREVVSTTRHLSKSRRDNRE